MRLIYMYMYSSFEVKHEPLRAYHNFKKLLLPFATFTINIAIIK